MNEVQQEAFKKLDSHIIDKGRILELTSYATKAAIIHGPLNVIAITNRMNLWDYIKMRTGGYLTKREMKALFHWLCQEPDRIKEER